MSLVTAHFLKALRLLGTFHLFQCYKLTRGPCSFPTGRRVELTFLYPFIACCGLHGIAVATVVAVMRGYRAQQVGGGPAGRVRAPSCSE